MTRTWKQGLIGACCAVVGVACGDVPADPAEARDSTRQARQTRQDALAALGRVEVVDVGKDGTPSFIRGQLGTADTALAALRAGDALAPALRAIAPVFGLRAEELTVRSSRVDDLGFTHIRYDQTRQGIRVVGGELVLHVNTAGLVYAANGSARGAGEPATLARFPIDDVKRAALEGLDTLVVEGEPRFVYFLGAEGSLASAWEVTRAGTREDSPARDRVYVDAASGRVLDVQPLIHSAQNRRIHSANNQWTTPGTLRRIELGAATGDNHVDVNYDHVGTTYACYETIFGRDSFDDRGATITSTVHYGASYVNAYWDGIQIVFGDGDGVNSGQLGLDLDVVSHEITHAVTQYESGLVYRNESGALNESLSDIAAAICESWARGGAIDADVWKIGEDIWTPNIGGDALRYMDNPTRDGSSKDYYPERYTGTADNGGVHWNSGIQNLVFKLLVTGGTHPRGKTPINVAGVGMNRAAQTFYFAATNYYTSTTTMSQAKAYTVQAAQDRYDASVVNAVRDAWGAAGVP
ncbi:M4 family metallopeptidase [Myxococcus sp. CA033]|uniref:M4 family metallopeptidase n=1 Tax=unclassified Myxococcus TaxID=2648731 RepID=UPI00352F1B65